MDSPVSTRTIDSMPAALNVDDTMNGHREFNKRHFSEDSNYFPSLSTINSQPLIINIPIINRIHRNSE